MNNWPELDNIYGALREFLQEESARLKALCEKAKVLGGEIKKPHQSSPPAVQYGGVLSAAKVDMADQAKLLRQEKQSEEIFRKKHNLDRGVNQPSVTMTVLILALQVFTEGLVNMSYLVNAYLVGGPTTGMMISLTISLTNVTVSAAAGYFIGRYLNYGGHAIESNAAEYAAIRKRARILFYLSVVALAFFHLTVGLIRATESLDILHHSLTNYGKIVTTPEALFLVMVGVVMSVLAYHKGLNGFDDPYPGYGARHRAVERPKNELNRTHEHYSDEIEARFKGVEEESATNKKVQLKAIANYNVAVDECQSVKRDYDLHVEQARNSFAAQRRKIEQTRSANSGREESVPPEILQRYSFDKLINFTLPKPINSPDHTSQREKLENAKSDALKKLNELFEQFLND